MISPIAAHLSEPPVMFDCYRTQRMVRAGIVNYDGCFVDTTKGEFIICICITIHK